MRAAIRPIVATIALSIAIQASATAQTTPPKLRVLGDADRVTLFKLKSAAFNGSDLAVVTEPEPGVHLFSANAHRGWGKKGAGPAELTNPENVVWAGGRILVHDFSGSNSKIVSYDHTGRFLGVRSTGACGLARGLQVTGPDTLLSSVAFGTRRRAIVRLSGERCDTIARYTLPEQIRLTAQGSPSLTVSTPFAPGPLWTALPGRRVAAWNGSSPSLLLLDTYGRTVGEIPLPRTRMRVSTADREWWIDNEIPADFMGQKVFEPLRRKAREEVKFPAYLPVALSLLPDPSGGVWVQRTTSGSGEIWSLVTASGEGASIKLPPGRELLSVGQRELAVKAKDNLDVETVEIFRKPQA